MTKIKHPRPQLRRDRWTDLNGSWKFLFDDENIGRKENWESNAPWDRKIIVPFSYETALSGIGDRTEHNIVWYEKEIEIAALENNERKILHFEGVDYTAEVWIDGRFAGSHTGPYSRFSMDISDLIDSSFTKHRITVRVEDSSNMEQPRGKQRWMKDSFACWYVQNTGIWKSVWMETVGETYLESLKMTPDIEAHEIQLEYEIARFQSNIELDVTISFDGRIINRCTFYPSRGHYKHCLNVEDEAIPYKIHLWYPKGFTHFDAAGPELYDLDIRIIKDGQILEHCSSYFGMRKVSIEDGQVLINNFPIYQKLILDQGYWPESSITPPDEDALIKDLEIIIDAGYNGVRKHQKTEDERFLYHCDKEGILVWSEVGSTYRFNDLAMKEFTRQWTEIVRQNYNHPCIVTWVPFNESWGVHEIARREEQQNFVNGIYNMTKGIDPMRPIVTNDGWEHTISDILTIHDYEEEGKKLYDHFKDKENLLSKSMSACSGRKRLFADGWEYNGQPIIISEFGGIAFASEEGWGYGNMVQTEDDFMERFDAINKAIQDCSYITGFCYTQLSDVEQEINGIVSADRKLKIPLEKLKYVNDRRN